MSVVLQTETEARRAWRGDMIVARQDRDLRHDLKALGRGGLAVLLLIMPLWKQGIPLIQDIPYGLAWLGIIGLIAYSVLQRRELQLARAPQAWLFAASPQRVWIKVRSYRHADWPSTDAVVLQYEAEDIKSFRGLKLPNGDVHLHISLAEEITSEAYTLIMDENTRREGEPRPRRANHMPVRIGADGKSLRLIWSGEEPRPGRVLDKLRLTYTVEPGSRLADIEDGVLPHRTPLLPQDWDEIARLLGEDNPEEAMQLICEVTGASREEARAVIATLMQAPPQAEEESTP